MMRRCILEFSSGRPIRRVPRQVATQMHYFFNSRKEFSAAPKQNASPGPPNTTGKPSESGSNLTKFVVGSVAIGAAVVAVYQTGYLGQPFGREEPNNFDVGDKVSKDVEIIEEKLVRHNQEPNRLSSNIENLEKIGEVHSNLEQIQDPSKGEGEVQVEGGLDVTLEVNTKHVQQEDVPSFSNGSNASVDRSTPEEISSEDSPEKKEIGSGFTYMKSGIEQSEGANDAPSSQETEAKGTSAHHLISEDTPEDLLANNAEPPSSLLDSYFLPAKNEGSRGVSSDGEVADGFVPFSKENEASVDMSEELKDAYISKDGKLILDFLQAIHVAEKRQAELDARIFVEEKRLLKEKYEKELRDARARELMYAEEAAILDKELNKERAKTAATVKSLQEKAEENLKLELERKENEAELQLKNVQDLAKAELAAAIASEKASQTEKMAEANLHINALCMAFYARSEEARQSHSVHKLALGSLALEDALSKGLPIQTEIAALHTYLEGIDRDSLLGLVLSSLPEETLNSGTDTPLQLNEKFDALKGALRHYSLIPPGGGGILAHTLAHIASLLKMREDDQSGDGIESVINRVDSFLADGKLAEAADALEGGVSGSQAEEIIGDWVRQVRNRAITEQALSLLQSYATSFSLA